MAVLLDVNLILAAAWDTHAEHTRARKWLLDLPEFVTCPITELGFIRVSMSPAYSASFENAVAFIQALRGLDSHHQVDDDMSPTAMPQVQRYKDTTDAYLVLLAKNHGLSLATLDRGILKQEWADGIAFNPLAV